MLPQGVWVKISLSTHPIYHVPPNHSRVASSLCLIHRIEYGDDGVKNCGVERCSVEMEWGVGRCSVEWGDVLRRCSVEWIKWCVFM